MPQVSRRGFTLVEVMIALVLLGIVTAALYRVLVNNQRIYQAQTQRIDLQQNIRAAATILPAEFRELNAYDGDILGMGPDSVRMRAMRQVGFICNAPVMPLLLGAPATFTVRQTPYYGGRPLQAGDSILVYHEGDQGSRADDAWVLGQVTGLQLPVNCPPVAPGTATPAGWQVSANLVFALPARNLANAIRNGAPVRGFEVVTYRLYQAADGKYYIGLRQGNTAIQPLVGPVLKDGLQLVYRDSLGAVTGNRLQVASIDIHVRAQTAQPVQGPGGGLITPVDSLVTRVALRNNRRF